MRYGSRLQKYAKFVHVWPPKTLIINLWWLEEKPYIFLFLVPITHYAQNFIGKYGRIITCMKILYVQFLMIVCSLIVKKNQFLQLLNTHDMFVNDEYGFFMGCVRAFEANPTIWCIEISFFYLSRSMSQSIELWNNIW